MKLTKDTLKKMIIQEMAAEMKGRFKSGFESDSGHEKAKGVNSAIVDIEEAVKTLEDLIKDEEGGQRMVDKLKKLIEQINDSYGMSEEDFSRQFEYPRGYSKGNK